jgi:hypothetical protein
MTSVLNVDTIADKAGTGPVALTKQSAAKAYVQFDGDAGTPVANKSINHSSIVDEGTGDYSVTVSSAFDGVDYGVVLTGGRTGASNGGGDMSLATATTAPTSTTTRIRSYRNLNSSAESTNDVSNITEVRYGDLA